MTEKKRYIIDDFNLIYDGIFEPQISHITKRGYINISLKTLKKIVQKLENIDLENKIKNDIQTYKKIQNKKA